MKLAALTGDTAAYSVCTNMWPWQLGDRVALAYRAIGQAGSEHRVLDVDARLVLETQQPDEVVKLSNVSPAPR